jgi:cob(I)alamin adenosyltransferase
LNLYTRTGDKGKTSIIGGRVDKDDLRVEAYGTIDEVNSFVGLAMTWLHEEKLIELYHEFEKIQHELFDCGSDLAVIHGKQKHPYKTTAEMIAFLEERIDHYSAEAPPLQRFILPGGTNAASAMHIARTVARRAERCIVSLQKQTEINEHVLTYMNRLSDYFFAAARVANARLGSKDVEYERSAIVFTKPKQS